MKIGDLEVVRRTRQILSNGLEVRVGSRAYDLLEVLLDANGALVPTARIIEKVWPSTVVEENNIQVHICALRRIFGPHRNLIQTVSGRGYRLTVPEHPAPATPPAAAARLAAVANPGPLERRFRLPDLHSRLIGRDHSLSSLISELESRPPLVTLAGAPGSGKSRLAVEASRRLSEGHGARTAYLSMSTASSRANPRAALDELIAAVSCDADSAATGQWLIVVIDNCDLTASHVIDSLNDRRLFGAAAHTTVIATSRAPLKLSMENIVYVDPLLPQQDGQDSDAAIDLFVARLRMLDPHAGVGESFPGKVRTLVSELDRLPLAIEVAAHQTSLLGIDVVISLLERNIGLPALPMRGLHDTHHVSFDAALRWTWDGFTRTQQAILAGFAQQGTDAGLDDLCAIGSALDILLHESIEAVSALVDQAFISRAYDGSSVRYRLSNTIRRFVRHQYPHGYPASTEVSAVARPPSKRKNSAQQVRPDSRIDLLSA